MLDNESAIQKLKKDTFFLKEATLIDNDILSVIVSYSGGCKKHDFILATVPHFTTTNSSHQANLVLAHENNGDACKKIVKEHLYFDLLRSEERRVGKEWRSRWSPDGYKTKDTVNIGENSGGDAHRRGQHNSEANREVFKD